MRCQANEIKSAKLQKIIVAREEVQFHFSYIFFICVVLYRDTKMVERKKGTFGGNPAPKK